MLSLIFCLIIQLLDTAVFSLFTTERESQFNFLISYLHNRFVHFQICNHLREDFLLRI